MTSAPLKGGLHMEGMVGTLDIHAKDLVGNAVGTARWEVGRQQTDKHHNHVPSFGDGHHLVFPPFSKWFLSPLGAHMERSLLPR